MPEKKQFKDLSPNQRSVVVVVAIFQLLLLIAAQRDISGRSDEQLRGPRRLWRAISMINLVGPLAYFFAGRR